MPHKLAQMLEDQYVEAKAKAGLKVVRTIPGWLRIEMLMPTTNEIRLTLASDANFPTLDDWEKVTKYFPFQVPQVMPTPERRADHRFIITARFPSKSIMQMKY